MSRQAGAHENGECQRRGGVVEDLNDLVAGIPLRLNSESLRLGDGD
jgi:hypothetical protein